MVSDDNDGNDDDSGDGKRDDNDVRSDDDSDARNGDDNDDTALKHSARRGLRGLPELV